MGENYKPYMNTLTPLELKVLQEMLKVIISLMVQLMLLFAMVL